MASAWGCPHENDNTCTRVDNRPCDPGMKGCVLAGRYFFFNNDAKNERLKVKRAREAATSSDKTVESADTSAPESNAPGQSS